MIVEKKYLIQFLNERLAQCEHIIYKYKIENPMDSDFYNQLLGSKIAYKDVLKYAIKEV